MALFALFGLSAAHKYKSGECPQVEPMQGYDMKKVSHAFDALWNVGSNWFNSIYWEHIVMIK